MWNVAGNLFAAAVLWLVAEATELVEGDPVLTALAWAVVVVVGLWAATPAAIAWIERRETGRRAREALLVAAAVAVLLLVPAVFMWAWALSFLTAAPVLIVCVVRAVRETVERLGDVVTLTEGLPDGEPEPMETEAATGDGGTAGSPADRGGGPPPPRTTDGGLPGWNLLWRPPPFVRRRVDSARGADQI